MTLTAAERLRRWCAFVGGAVGHRGAVAAILARRDRETIGTTSWLVYDRTALAVGERGSRGDREYRLRAAVRTYVWLFDLTSDRASVDVVLAEACRGRP